MNKEGYKDPTAEFAVSRADRMPRNVQEVYHALQRVAGLHGFEIMGLRDVKTKKEFRK